MPQEVWWWKWKESFLEHKGYAINDMFIRTIANLSFNCNYNLVIAEISFTLWFSNNPLTQPPTYRKSSDNRDISAVTDQMLMNI